jgi:hypothetical protein
MIGKLGMSVQDCIDAYENLSKRIFGFRCRRLMGTISGGHLRPRYDTENLRMVIGTLIDEHPSHVQSSSPMVGNGVAPW